MKLTRHLTKEQRLRIVAVFNRGGVSQVALSKRFGVSETTICTVLKAAQNRPTRL
jgi:transposase